MAKIKYRVLVEFETPADDPAVTLEKLEQLKQVGEVTVKSATKTKDKKD